MRLSIVIPTLNRLEVLGPCLRSIERFTAVEHEVIVHANACSDETAAFLEGRENVRTIREPANRFFTQAVNCGISEARGEYVFLMNDDCVVTGPAWTDFYFRLLDADERIGAVGPHWRNIDELPYGWIEPYAAMYPRRIFEELGPLPFFDDSFCLWWSDIYHAYRLMQNGYCLLPLERGLADSVVRHARPAGSEGATVIKMRSHLPPECFEFHGKQLMYDRLGIDDEDRLAGYYGGRIWTREEITALADLPPAAAATGALTRAQASR